jgi:hypothetical protein
MSGDAILAGGCQCGRVRYALAVSPHDISVCHCRMCQKAVGGPFAALAVVHAHELTWTRGKPGAFRSSTIATRLFCIDCGTPLAYVNDDSGDIELTTGSLDHPDRAVPTRATGNEGRRPWIDSLRSLPAQTTEELYATREKRHIISYQHPDHETPADWSPRDEGAKEATR